MIEDTVFIALNEREADPAHRGLHEPSLTYLLDGAPEPGGPLRQVARVRGVVVNLICGTVDPLADVPRSRSHGATMPDATDIAIAQEPQLLALKRQDSERAARLCRNRANIRWPQSTSAAHAPAPVTAIGQIAGNSHRGPRGTSLRSQARRVMRGPC